MQKIKLLVFLCILFSITLYSQNAEIERLKLAQSYEKGGSFIDAARMYLELYNINSGNEEYFNGYIRANKSLNKFSELIPFLENHIQKYPKAETWVILGEMQWRSGKNIEANNSWAKAIELENGNPEIYNQVALSQIAVRQYEKSANTYKEARKKLGQKDIFADQLSQLYIMLGDFKSAIDEIFLLFDSTANLSLVQGRISALKTNNDAAKYLDEFLKSRSNTGKTQYMQVYAWYLTTTGKLSEAFNIYKEIDQTLKLNGQEVYNFAVSSMKDGNYDIAISAYKYIIDFGKGNPFITGALFGLARTLELKSISNDTLEQKTAEEIISRYRTIIKDYSGTQYSEDARFRIANLYAYQLHDFSLAIKETKELIKETRNARTFATSTNFLANMFLMGDNLDSAGYYFKLVIQKNKRNYPEETIKSKYGLALIEYFSSNLDSALVHFTELSQASNSDIANDALEKITILEPNKELVKALNLYSNAELKLLQRKYDDACGLFLESAKSAEGSELSEKAMISAAKLDIKLKRPSNAIQILQKLLDSNPETIYGDYILFNIGIINKDNGNNEASLKYFNDLLQKYPRSIYSEQTRENIRTLRSKFKM